MAAPTDEQLLAQFLAGDEGSYELLVRRYVRELFQFTVRFTNDSMSAEDVVQEALLQVYTAADKFDPSRRFKPWLFTIAANKARDLLRRRKRRRELPFDAQVADTEDSGKRFIDLFMGQSDEPDAGLAVEERRAVVREAVAAMPDRLREVLILAYYHRLPYKEIATIIEVPLGTVKSRLHAAIVAFRDNYESLADELDGDEPSGGRVRKTDEDTD